jgi:hypothetical protein
MTPACFPSTSSSPSTCLLPAAGTLQQSWPRITRFSFAALVPSAGLFLAHYAGQDAAFVHTQTYVSFMQVGDLNPEPGARFCLIPLSCCQLLHCAQAPTHLLAACSGC